MATDLDICNLALSHLGEDADVESIDPPEESLAAERCAIFYPMARDKLLEMHTWSFATKRITAAELDITDDVDAPITSWQHAYTKPTGCLKIISVIPPGAFDDYSTAIPGGTVTMADGSLVSQGMAAALYQSQPFVMEADTDDTPLILTNQAEAVVRYIEQVTDATKFSMHFVMALSRLLASYLAGPIVKGDVGRAEAKSQYQFFIAEFQSAVGHDATQRMVNPQHSVPWIVNR